jgi:hypothetical protein
MIPDVFIYFSNFVRIDLTNLAYLGDHDVVLSQRSKNDQNRGRRVSHLLLPLNLHTFYVG